MTSSLQRIQMALTQAKANAQSATDASRNAASQNAASPLLCSFDLRDRRLKNDVGPNSMADVSSPWFPKTAFQAPVAAPQSRQRSPLITLKVAKSAALNPQASQQLDPAELSQTDDAVAAAAHLALSSPFESLGQQNGTSGEGDSCGADVFEVRRADPSPDGSGPESLGLDSLAPNEPSHSEVLTAETLASLFGQVEPLVPVAEELRADSATALPLTPASEAEQSDATALAEELQQSFSRVKPIQEVDPPTLPRAKAPQFSTHQNRTNPMLPLGLLQDIGKEVVVWQQALQQVHQKIQALYQEGPILNGWLEQPVAAGPYQLCGLDAEGKSWRRPCLPEQLHPVSLAIARYKQLRQLLDQKQHLDHRIKRLSETLTMLRGRLRAY